MKKYNFMLGFILLLFCTVTLAADPEPLVMLKNTSTQILAELDKNITVIKTNQKLVGDMVDRILVPHFDLLSMSRAVVGREYWQQAAAVTQQQFIKEFTRYVVRTYASAMQSYDGEKIKFYPIRDFTPGQSRVQISSDLLQKSGPAIQIQYRLAQQNGTWVIYDFSVDGVSIIKNYNSQFAATLRQNGLDQLVKQLSAKNRS